MPKAKSWVVTFSPREMELRSVGLDEYLNENREAFGRGRFIDDFPLFIGSKDEADEAVVRFSSGSGLLKSTRGRRNQLEKGWAEFKQWLEAKG